MQISENFQLQEFVPKVIFETYGVNARWFINPIMIEIAEDIRKHFGKPLIINTWHTNKNGFQNRGYRVPDSNIGAKFSQHKFGRAIDFNVLGLDAQEVSNEIINNPNVFLSMGITTIEDPAFTKTWTHVDTRWTLDSSKLLIVKP